MNKENYLRELMMALAKESLYAKSIFKKYGYVAEAWKQISDAIRNDSKPLIEKFLREHPKVNINTLYKYLDEGKGSKDNDKDVQDILRAGDMAMARIKVKLPKFTENEMKKMHIGLVDILKSSQMVDERKFIFPWTKEKILFIEK